MSVFVLAALAALSDVVAPSPAPAIPPATIDDTLEITGESVAARQVQTRMSVPVRLNGRGPYRFVVDSGADRSVVGRTLAERLALPPGRPVTLQGMAGARLVDTVRVDRLQVGGSSIEDLVVPALPENDLGAQGLLGIDALAEQRVMLDFDAKTITVQDSRRPEPAAYGEIIVTARRRNGQLILTQARVGRANIYAVIDSGSEVTIGNAALFDRVVHGRARRRVRPIELISVTGQRITANSVMLDEIMLGGVTLKNVSVAFADVPPFALFGLDRQPALLLGTDVLQTFRRVSLDFRQRKVRFLLRR